MLPFNVCGKSVSGVRSYGFDVKSSPADGFQSSRDACYSRTARWQSEQSRKTPNQVGRSSRDWLQGHSGDTLMNAKTQVESLLKLSGAKLTRSKKHQVWKFPSGKTLVISSTPSDRRAYSNALRDLAALGIKPEPRVKRATTKLPVKPNGKRNKAEKPSKVVSVPVVPEPATYEWRNVLSAACADTRLSEVVHYESPIAEPNFMPIKPDKPIEFKFDRVTFGNEPTDPSLPEWARDGLIPEETFEKSPDDAVDNLTFLLPTKLPWWSRLWKKVTAWLQ